MVEWSSAAVVPSRRSSRNFGVKRRKWHHLLRANPDEHDTTRPGGHTSTASSPGREHAGQQTRLTKLCPVKSSSDSAKSDVCSTATSHKASPSQASQKGLMLDRKRTHKKVASALVPSSKKPRHSTIPCPTKHNSDVATVVPAQSGLTYRFTENGLVSSAHEAAPDLSCLSYR